MEVRTVTDEAKQAIDSLGSTLASADEARLDEIGASSCAHHRGTDGDVNGESNQTNEIDPRHCEHFYGDGRRCKGWKVSGRSYCAGHSGLGVAASPQAAAAAARRSAVVRQEKAQ